MSLRATPSCAGGERARISAVSGRQVPGYYELIQPAPGRPSNRYRIGHVPFVTAMNTPGWSNAQGLGQGPDYFFRHLDQARRTLPDGPSIPAALTWVWPLFWFVFLIGAALMLLRQHDAAARTAGTETAAV